MPSSQINVIGASGAGATTLGLALANALSIPHFDCDHYFHLPTDPPFQHLRSPKDRVELLERDLTPHASFVLSGGVFDWEPRPSIDFSHVIFIYTPPEERIARLRRREGARYGKRILPGGDMYANHEAFIDWASRYDVGDIDGKTLSKHLDFLSKLECPVLRLRGERPLSELLDTALSSIRRD